MKHINVFHRIAAVLLCLCMLLPLSACGETKMYQKQVFAMDTVMTLTAYGSKGRSRAQCRAERHHLYGLDARPRC